MPGVSSRMDDVVEFIDTTLQREGSWSRAEAEQARLESDLRFYGSSVGAVRGTIRDALRRYPDLTHDDITALSSGLWAVPVFERRLAAIILLQSNVRLLNNSDLTRIEGFVRDARVPALVDPLAVDVVGPMIQRLDASSRARADVVLERWAEDPDVWLRRAALMSPLQSLRKGQGDWDRFARHARTALAQEPDADSGSGIIREAVSFILTETADTRPELHLPLPTE